MLNHEVKMGRERPDCVDRLSKCPPLRVWDRGGTVCDRGRDLPALKMLTPQTLLCHIQKGNNSFPHPPSEDRIELFFPQSSMGKPHRAPRSA